MLDPTAENPMLDLAVTYNEMVKGFVEGGFSRKEAMQFALEHFSITMEHAMGRGNDGED